MTQGGSICVLVVEDGNEYMENLSRYVQGPEYVQARSAATAINVLRSRRIDLVYLDMRFDRIPVSELVGDHGKATRDHNGDPERGWRYLQNNQGLFILDALRQAGFGHLPVVLAYDFSREQRRFDFLRATWPGLKWVSDAATAKEVRSLILEGACSYR